MKIHFNLRDAKAREKTSIVLVCRHFQKSLKWSTGEHIAPTLWDAKKNRPKSGQLPHLRERLNQLEALAEKALSGAGFLEQSEFTKLMDEADGKKEPDKTPYLLAFVRAYCLENTRQALRTTATLLFNMVAGQNVEKWGLIDWEKAKGKDVRFDTIDWNFREKFSKYQLNKGLSSSYVHANLKRLGLFLNASRKAGYHSNVISLESGFNEVKNSHVKQVPVTLTIEEVTKLAALKLSGIEEKTRDLFLIGIFCGQRFSDYSRITPNQVKGNALFFRQKKTTALVEIDLDMWDGIGPTTLGALLAKYGNASPIISRGKNSDIKFNEQIKALCRRAGILSPVEIVRTYGGKVTTEQVEKWTVVSSHTARRTFATTWHRLGLPLADIASATGHTTEKQLMEYIGLTHEEKRERRRASVDAAKAAFVANARKAI
jgi:integrase